MDGLQSRRAPPPLHLAAPAGHVCSFQPKYLCATLSEPSRCESISETRARPAILAHPVRVGALRSRMAKVEAKCCEQEARGPRAALAPRRPAR
jgi:hypothetical protein